jgi:Uma2 family endonuclease
MAEPPGEEPTAAARTDEKGEAASPSSEERMSRVVGVWSTTLDIMTAFAAPRVLAKVPAAQLVEMTQERVTGLFDDYIGMFGGAQSRNSSPSDVRRTTVEPVRRVRALLQGWQVSHPAPGPLVQTAREFLAAFGLPEPEEGWDAWEGPKDEPDPRAVLPPPRALRPESMTIEEWAAWRGPGELVDGVLVEEEAATPLHDAVVARLLDVLSAWASSHGAQAFGPGHKLLMSAAGGRKPDVCVYVASDRLEEDDATSRRPPSLVVEVLSPGKIDQRRDRVTKAHEYARFGARFRWHVDPVERYIMCTQLTSDGQWLVIWIAEEGKLVVPELEGLVLDLDALWAGVAGHRGSPPDVTA